MKTSARSLFFAGLGVLMAVLTPVLAQDAAVPVAPTMPAVPSAPPAVTKGYLQLSFDYLSSFNFVPPTADAAADEKAAVKNAAAQIPARVKNFNGKKAVLTGYMMPVRMEKGLVTEFILMRNTAACCYGATPNINEWVTVKMRKGVPPTMDVPVEFYGELKVTPKIENGYLSSIYQLDGERMGDVKI